MHTQCALSIFQWNAVQSSCSNLLQAQLAHRGWLESYAFSVFLSSQKLGVTKLSNFFTVLFQHYEQ